MLRAPWARIVGGILACAIFVVAACSLYVGFHGVTWVSPDESATALVARSFAEHGTFVLQEPRNPEAGGVLGPRSFVAVGATLLPIGFLGIAALAGMVATLLSPASLILIGPVFGALGSLSLYIIMRRLTADRMWALASAAMLALHPGYFFYSARSLMPNVPFVALLLMSIAVACLTSGATFMGGIGSGLLLGAALTVRLFEALWVLVLALAALIVAKEYVTPRFVIGLALGFGIIMASLLLAQNSLYGNPLKTGYTTSATIDASLVPTAVATIPSSPLFTMLFPFGFHEYNILSNVWSYGVLLYPWMTILAIVGMVLTFHDIRTERRAKCWRLAMIAFAVVGIWLAMVYGSGKIADNPDPRALTLANSYVRYWLPLIVMAAPFAGYAIVRGYALVATRSHRWGVVAMMATIALGVGLLTWRVTTGPDGIPATRRALRAGEEKRAAIELHTEPSAIVIVDRSDKFIYPTRSVVTPLLDPTTLAALPRLRAAAPVYYLGLPLPEADRTHLNTVLLNGTGLHFIPMVMIEDEMLYRLER